MKAAQIHKFAVDDAIRIAGVERPPIPDNGVMVEVHAAGVNPIDWKIRSGMLQLPLPMTAGGDFAGVVVKTGSTVTGFHPGDEVYGQSSGYRGGSGSFAEYTIADAKHIAMKPDGIDFLHAGALPLAASSALQALEEPMALSSGEKILIHGGAGGIGSIAIQIANHRGAIVTTTVSEADIEYARSLGARNVIDYHKNGFEKIAREYDAVLDLVGGETYRKSFPFLKPGGTIVSLLSRPDDELMRRYAVTAVHQFTGVTRERLEKVAKMVEQGVIHVRIDRVFSLDETEAALTYLEKGHPTGKVVLRVRG